MAEPGWACHFAGEPGGHGLQNSESEVPGQRDGPKPPGSVPFHNPLAPGSLTIRSASRHHTRAFPALMPPSALATTWESHRKEPRCRPLSYTRQQALFPQALLQPPASTMAPPHSSPSPRPSSPPCTHPTRSQAQWMKLTAQAGNLGRSPCSRVGGGTALVAHC